MVGCKLYYVKLMDIPNSLIITLLLNPFSVGYLINIENAKLMILGTI